MTAFRATDWWPRLLVFCCFVGVFLLAPPKIDEFYLSQSGWDLGAQFLFRGWQGLLHSYDSSPGVFAKELFTFQAAIMFLLSLLMLLPNVPLLVAIGGEATLLLIWCVFGDISSRYHAVESWTVVLVAMFIAAVAYWKGSGRDYVTSVLFGIVLGYMPLMRQSASFIVVMPCAILASCGLLIASVNMYLSRRGRRVKRRVNSTAACPMPEGIRPSSLYRYALPVLVMLVFFFAVRFGADRLWVMIYKAPMKPHGTGYSLVSSLGFANNAYGTAWDDDASRAQGLLVESVYWEDNPYGHRKLTNLWLARVLEDPALVVRGGVAKSLYLLRYFSGTLDPLKTQQDQYPLKPSSITLLLGIGFCVGAGGCSLIFFRCRHDRMRVLFAGTVGLLAGSLLPLVMIAPFYLGSAIACSAALLFMVLPAAVLLGRETKGVGELNWERNTLFYKCAGASALLLLLALSGFTLVRSVTNRLDARELVTSDPAQKLKELGYRYSHRFNRLPLAEQQKVLDRLTSSLNSQSIFRPMQPFGSDPQRIFTPVLTFIGDGARSLDVPPTREGLKILFVVARMSEQWQMLLPSRVQGPRNSVLLVLKNRDRRSGVHTQFEAPGKYLKIADANWDGRYHMFCLPEPLDIADGAEFFNVSAYNFKDGEHGPRGLVLELISGDRLYRHEAVSN